MILLLSDIMGEDMNLSFEDFKNQNGMTYWWSSDLMRMLGYKDLKSFRPAIERAIKACMTVKIPYEINFVPEDREVDGALIKEYKLSRFACYITVMNSDPKKEEVAKAQIYFVDQTRKFELSIQNHEEFECLQIREELKEGNKSLTSIAKKAGVDDFAKFVNAGYLGLYNMFNYELARRRNVDSKELINYMSRTELAANLFRVTQTEELIKREGTKGQYDLESAHKKVGQQVRSIVKQNTGKNPEDLPQQKYLPTIHKELKDGYKKMIKSDIPIKIKKTKP